MNLETITTLLAEHARQLTKQHTLDMSMFPKEAVPRIYAAVAEQTLRKRDFETTGHFLYLAQDWERLLALGVPLLRSTSAEEQEAGKRFLYMVASQHTLPKAIAIELADHIFKQDGERASHSLARVLDAGDAKDRAEQFAYQFLAQGNFDDAKHFLKVAGRTLTPNQVDQFAGVSLDCGRYHNAFTLYKEHNLPLPKERARLIVQQISLDTYLVDEIMLLLQFWDEKDRFLPPFLRASTSVFVP